MIIARNADLSSLPSPPPQSFGARHVYPASLVDGYNRFFLAIATCLCLMLVLVAAAMGLNLDSCTLWAITLQMQALSCYQSSQHFYGVSF